MLKMSKKKACIVRVIHGIKFKFKISLFETLLENFIVMALSLSFFFLSFCIYIRTKN